MLRREKHMHAKSGREINTWMDERAYAWVRYGKWDGTLDRMQMKDVQSFWHLVNMHRIRGVVSICNTLERICVTV
jgi:hypothetical protein